VRRAFLAPATWDRPALGMAITLRCCISNR